MLFRRLIAVLLVVSLTSQVIAADKILTDRLQHLHRGAEPEWCDFPKAPANPKLELKFQATANLAEVSLTLRQVDVRDTWRVLLNGMNIGSLQQDENDMLTVLAVPPNAIKNGENSLTIEQSGKLIDDIYVGTITLHDLPRDQYQAAGTVAVHVIDSTEKDSPKATPARITILTLDESLAPIGDKSNDQQAIRTGVVYTSNGQATFRLPAGEYTLYAGRGFEYGIDSRRISVRAGQTVRETLSIQREVPTEGWVSCDTHVHTLTHSGHGDATLDERMITLAAEGIELPIATDHNVQIDYQPAARKIGVRAAFTPVIGNEVTTSIGHFNVFPLTTSNAVPDYKATDWKHLFDQLLATDHPRVVILNHARDIHAKFRPFGPEHHLALTGENLDGWKLRANAMEIINSGAQQTDQLQLTHDWMQLLNRGVLLTPVGASDSHDVSRYIVGQGRTYIRCRDDQPGDIPVDEAIDHFLKGQVMVSCGLLSEITVNDKFGPGELASSADELRVSLRVLGPSWVKADTVTLYANGIKVREESIQSSTAGGVKWSDTWTIPRFRHDVHLVAVASGPGTIQLYWPIARPYQPTSNVFLRRGVGVTGAVWIDGDSDGKRSTAFDYATRLWTSSGQNVEKIVADLDNFDDAVSYQAASILKQQRVSFAESTRKATPKVREAFQHYEEAWRASQSSRLAP